MSHITTYAKDFKWLIIKSSNGYTDKIAVFKEDDLKTGNECISIFITNDHVGWNHAQRTKIRLDKKQAIDLANEILSLAGVEQNITKEVN